MLLFILIKDKIDYLSSRLYKISFQIFVIMSRTENMSETTWKTNWNAVFCFKFFLRWKHSEESFYFNNIGTENDPGPK